jgi:hypothetical protein
MTEKNLVIDGLELDYEGIFNMHDFLDKIDELAAKRGYAKSEKRREEHVYPSGKSFSIELKPTKVKNPDLWLTIKMRINIKDVKDTIVKREKRKVRLQKGKIHIIFDAWVFSTIEFKWEAPWYTFFRKVFQKAFSLTHIISAPETGEVSADCHYVYDNLRAFLNLYRYMKEKK